MGHEAGREVPDSVAERVRPGVLQVGAVVDAQQSGVWGAIVTAPLRNRRSAR